MERFPPDTFCSVINGVVCDDCPLTRVEESAWRSSVRPGTTPFDVGEEMDLTLRDRIPPDTTAQEWLDTPGLSEADEEAFYNLNTDEAVASLRQGSFDLSGGSDERNQVIRQLGLCVRRIEHGECSTYREDAEPAATGHPPFAGLATPDVAAETLATIARHGSDDEVGKMASRLAGWAQEVEDTQGITGTDITQRAAHDQRSILMAIAEILKTFEENR